MLFGITCGFVVYVLVQLVAQRGALLLAFLGASARGVASAQVIGAHLQAIASPLALLATLAPGPSFYLLFRRAPRRSELLLVAVTGAALVLAFFETRLVSMPALLATIGWQGAQVRRGTTSKATGVFWLVFFLLSASPVDLTLIQYPGPARFVEVTGGAPSRSLLEDAPRRDLILLGEDGRGLARWLWVW